MPPKIIPMTAEMLARVREEVMQNLRRMFDREGERVAQRIHREAQERPKAG